jgi:GNAT superfamily N-acetyltransferase
MAFRRVETRRCFLATSESIEIRSVWADQIDRYQYDQELAAIDTSIPPHLSPVVGSMLLSYFRDPAGINRLLITSVIVDREHRRQGVATALYNEAKRLAEESGYELEHTWLTDEGAAWKNSLPS